MPSIGKGSSRRAVAMCTKSLGAEEMDSNGAEQSSRNARHALRS